MLVTLPFLTVFKFLLRWFPLFSLSVLLVLSLEQQWLHESTCNVEILHRAQMGQDVYIYGIRTYHIMAYGSTPYVGMAPKKNGGHIKSAQMTRLKCLR